VVVAHSPIVFDYLRLLVFYFPSFPLPSSKYFKLKLNLKKYLIIALHAFMTALSHTDYLFVPNNK